MPPPSEPPEGPPEMWEWAMRFKAALGDAGDHAVFFPLFDIYEWNPDTKRWRKVPGGEGKSPMTPKGKPIPGPQGVKDEWNGTGWTKLQTSLPPDHPAWQQATGVGVNLRTIPTIAIIDDDGGPMDAYVRSQIDDNPGWSYSTAKGRHHWYENTARLTKWDPSPAWGEYGAAVDRNIALPGSAGKQTPDGEWIINSPFPPIDITAADADLDPATGGPKWGRWTIGDTIEPGEQDDTLISIAGWLVETNPALFTEAKVAETLWEKVIEPGFCPPQPGKRPYTKADCERIARSADKWREAAQQKRTQGGQQTDQAVNFDDDGARTGNVYSAVEDDEVEQEEAAPAPDGGLIVEWLDQDGQPLDDDDLPFWWKEARKTVRAKGESWPLTMGALLLRASTHIHPAYHLPPLPSPAPLNLFGVSVAEPSGGKSASWDMATAMIPPNPVTHLMEADGIAPVSGAAIAEAYLEPGRKDEDERRKEWAVLYHFDEGARFEELLHRAGNDVASVLRTGWSGKHLGTVAATKERRRFIEAGTYRLSLSVFTQPSVPLPTVRDVQTGMGQRFLAFPADDKEGLEQLQNPDFKPDAGWVEPLGWTPPDPPAEDDLDHITIPVDPDILTEIGEYRRAARLAPQLGNIPEDQQAPIQALIDTTIGSPQYEQIDHGNHTKQLQLRVAAVLAALRKPRDFQILPQDWNLAWAILRVSKATLDHYDQHLTITQQTEDRQQAIARGLRQAVSDDVGTGAAIQRIYQIAAELCEQAETLADKQPLNEPAPPLAKMWRKLNSKKRTRLNQLLGGKHKAARRLWEEEIHNRGIYPIP